MYADLNNTPSFSETLKSKRETPFARTLLDDTTAAEARETLGIPGEINKRALRVIHKGFAYDYSTTTIVVRDGTSDNLHRHFGQICEGLDGRLHLVYGRNSIHGLTAGATSYHTYSDDGGATWSAETEVIPSDAAADQRSLSMCVTPTGRVVLIYAKALAPSASPTVFRLRYSDDNGATWTQGADIVTINYAYARTYGRIKLIPGDSTCTYRLAFTPYYQNSATPTYKVPVWLSEDDGETWAEGAQIIDDATGYNETELVAINAKTWIAVSRSGSGLNVWKTINGGSGWSSVGIVPLTSTDSYVAPTLDKFCRNGRWYVLLGYCNRTNTSGDEEVWRIADVEGLLSSSAAFSGELITASDMENASGYQSAVTKPDGSVYIEGRLGYIHFKEYDGQTYSQVRFVSADILGLAAETARSATVASGAITVYESEFERQIFVDTEAAAATDDLDTISGGFDGQEIVLKSGSSSRDVILKNGTGNLKLTGGDYRLSTTDSRIVLRRVGTIWVEVARNTDHVVAAAYVISAGAITVANGPPVGAILIDTEAAAATDDLDTISGGGEGQVIMVFSATSSRDPTVKDGTGNLSLAGDLLLSNASDCITLIKRGSTWYEVSRSDNA